MQLIRRRSFIGYLSVAALSGHTLLTTGCSEHSVMTDIKNWAPTGKRAFDSIASLLVNAGVIPLGLAAKALIDGTFDQLETDAAAYLAITPPPAGALANVEATLNVIITNLQNFFASLTLPASSLLSMIVDLAGIIFSTIAGFLGGLPPAMAQMASRLKAKLSTAYRVGAGSHDITPRVRNEREFKHDFSAIAKAYHHPEAAFPR
jgi:hypothetical protein